MKKGLLLMTGALVLGGLVACGPDKKIDDSSTGPSKEVKAILDSFKSAKLDSTLDVTYTAKYALDVTKVTGMDNYERQIDDVITIKADFSEANPYLHIKRVGTEFAESTDPELSKKDTYEALVVKTENSYTYLTSYMEDAVTLDSADAAFTKMAELITKVSTRRGGGLSTKSFIYDGMYDYEHREFVLGAKGYKREDMNDKITYTITEDKGLKIETKMNYVSWQTDGGFSELNKLPDAAATINMDVTKDGFVTKMDEVYNSPSLDMPLGSVMPHLTLTGKRNFTAKYGEDIGTRLTTIEHSGKPATVTVKSYYNGGTVEVFYSKANADLSDPTQVKKFRNNKDTQVFVGDWIIVKVTSNPELSEGVTSVSLDENSITVKDPATVNGFYIFEAQFGAKNQINVVFTNAAEALYTFEVPADETLKTYFKSYEVVRVLLNAQYQPQGIQTLKSRTTKYTAEIDNEYSTWIGFKVGADQYVSKEFTLKLNDKVINAMAFPQGDFYITQVKAPATTDKFSIAEKVNTGVDLKDGVKIVTPAAVELVVPTYSFYTDFDFASIPGNAFVGEKIIAFDSKLAVNINNEALEGKVTVKINGKQYKAAQAHYYSIDLTEANGFTKGETYTVEFEYSADAVCDGKAHVGEVTKPDALQVEGDLVSYVLLNKWTDYKSVADGITLEEGQVYFLAIMVPANVKDNYTVKVNGLEAQWQQLYFAFQVKGAGLYNITITAK